MTFCRSWRSFEIPVGPNQAGYSVLQGSRIALLLDVYEQDDFFGGLIAVPALGRASGDYQLLQVEAKKRRRQTIRRKTS